MSNVDQRRVAILTQEGAHDEALSLLEQAFRQIELTDAAEQTEIFMTMFQWRLLADDYAPARAALRNLRDTQVERLLGGDIYVGLASQHDVEEFRLRRRFSLIVEMNETLRDHQSTCDVFATLDRDHPALARRYARTALPALVEVGNFQLADQYGRDPLQHLSAVNEAALTLTLHPSTRQAPRLAADLTNLVQDVRIGMAVFRGLGHDDQADVLREALLSGLHSDDLRTVAQRELAEPGTITRELVAHQMAQEALSPFSR
jgi:hypothetical protein